MSQSESAFPLTWPTGKPRTKSRESRAPFSIGDEREKTERNWSGTEWVEIKRKIQGSKPVSVPVATERLEQQLEFLGASLPVLSTNLELRLNGMPRGGQKDPEDPGAAIWFTLKGRRMVIACDRWTRVADNIAALAATIRSTRSIDKYGAVTVEEAFRGYQALEDFSRSGVPWRRVLGFKDDEIVTKEVAETKYRERMKAVHPDMTGESGLQASQLNLAIEQARTELRP